MTQKCIKCGEMFKLPLDFDVLPAICPNCFDKGNDKMVNNKRFKNWKYPEFDERNTTKWNWVAIHREKLKIGYGSDIGCFTFINAKYGVNIGKNVQIGSHTSIYSEDTERDIRGSVMIGEGALIGSHCLILPGVYIKPFRKIPAMSVVKDGDEID